MDRSFAVLRRASPASPAPYAVREFASFAFNGVSNGIAVDDYYVYYFNGAGTLFSSNKDGSGSEVVISNFVRSGFWLAGADACFAYGVDAMGSLVRSPKEPYFADDSNPDAADAGGYAGNGGASALGGRGGSGGAGGVEGASGMGGEAGEQPSTPAHPSSPAGAATSPPTRRGAEIGSASSPTSSA